MAKDGGGLLHEICEHVPYPNNGAVVQILKAALAEYEPKSTACKRYRTPRLPPLPPRNPTDASTTQRFVEYFRRTWLGFRIGFAAAFTPPGFPKTSNQVESGNGHQRKEEKRLITSVPQEITRLKVQDPAPPTPPTPQSD